LDVYAKEMRKRSYSNGTDTLSWFSKAGLIEMDGTQQQEMAIVG
jgi:hypothetical protein